jgi:hypothetical protein
VYGFLGLYQKKSECFAGMIRCGVTVPIIAVRFSFSILIQPFFVTGCLTGAKAQTGFLSAG